MDLKFVFMPMIRYEMNHLLSWLYYCPDPGENDINLVISIDTSWDLKDKHDIEKIFSMSVLKNRNWKLEFIDCEMNNNESFYIKDPEADIDLEIYPYGQKSGPNLQFYRTCRKIIKKYNSDLGAGLLMEVDAFPVRKNWFSILKQNLKNKYSLMICGSHYQGQSELTEQIRFHYNGNSVYNFKHPDFLTFLDSWEDLLIESLKVAKHLAYDVVINWYNFFKKKNPYIRDLKVNNPHLIESVIDENNNLNSFLINWGGDCENENEFIYSVNEFALQYPKALIVHGKCFMNTISYLRGAYESRDLSIHHPLNYSIFLIKKGFIDQSILYGGLGTDLTLFLARNSHLIPEESFSLFKESMVSFK